MKTTFNSQRSLAALFGYAVLILVPSFDSVHKYFGPAGLAVYFVVGFAVLYAGVNFVYPFLSRRISKRVADILAVVAFIALTITTSYFYQIANTNIVGQGSDADDAMITAATELVTGHFPYYHPTYLGNPISPLPGAILLSLPFVLLGVFWFQNIFWLGVFFLIVRSHRHSSFDGLFVLGLVLAVSPTVFQNLFTGSDYISNAIYVAAAMWFLIEGVADRESPEWWRVLSAIFLGVALSSRSNFVLVLPILFLVIYQLGGLASAIKYFLIAGVMGLAVTLPFYLYHPAGFTPLIVQASKVQELDTFLPFAGVLIPLTGLVLAGILALRKYGANDPTFYRNCAIVQLTVLLLASAIWSLKLGKLDIFIGQSGYGMFTLGFAMFAFWLSYFNGVDERPK